MSENEEQVPLTRRERRLREQGETGALDLSELSAAVAEADAAPVVDPAPSGTDDDIEISPFNADGTPRSRREIRLLREQALAARAAAAEASPQAEAATEAEAATVPAPEVDSETHIDSDAESGVAADAGADVEVTDATAAEAGESVPDVDDELVQDFDSLISPPTEPFTVEELREAEALAEAPVPEADDSQAEPAGTSSVAEPTTPPSGGKSRLKFWKRDKTAEAAVPEAAEPEVAEPETEAIAPETVALEVAPAEPEAGPEAEVEVETEVEEVEAEPEAEVDEVEAEAEVEPEAEAEEAEAEAEEAEAEVELEVEEVASDARADEPISEESAAVEEAADAQPKETYSFPDIAPPEEWRSVFDDPATRNVPAPAEEPQGDFDDLISRAVAQEGSTNGTSALILPSMPEDTGGLTGPLGATGELYVTGSLRLPKSLGETGGHVSLHDSAEIDPITGAEAAHDHGTVAGPAPVSARHAVSARVVSGVPAVAKPTKERTKMPLILGLTGGGLLVVVVGLGIWGFSNGMFG